jgi:hypothetical protein
LQPFALAIIGGSKTAVTQWINTLQARAKSLFSSVENSFAANDQLVRLLRTDAMERNRRLKPIDRDIGYAPIAPVLAELDSQIKQGIHIGSAIAGPQLCHQRLIHGTLRQQHFPRRNPKLIPGQRPIERLNPSRTRTSCTKPNGQQSHDRRQSQSHILSSEILTQQS